MFIFLGRHSFFLETIRDFHYIILKSCWKVSKMSISRIWPYVLLAFIKSVVFHLNSERVIFLVMWSPIGGEGKVPPNHSRSCSKANCFFILLKAPLGHSFSYRHQWEEEKIHKEGWLQIIRTSKLLRRSWPAFPKFSISYTHFLRTVGAFSVLIASVPDSTHTCHKQTAHEPQEQFLKLGNPKNSAIAITGRLGQVSSKC